MSAETLNAAQLRRKFPKFGAWAEGYGLIKHTDDTQLMVFSELQRLEIELDFALPLLKAADRICSQAMWLVIHMSYATRVKLNGEALAASDFKESPQGHTGGSLNMVPAYVGYLTANAISGDSREWLMGQGHCVSAIDSVNLLLQNSLPLHEQRYPLSDQGLSRLTRDFYSYDISSDGSAASPVGSHVNVNTAGASIEGGYLGFAGLHYVHQPLPGEKLVAFLSDGAFEEQRGSDWSARWWRNEDCGLVVPIMIANGRRIDQRTTAQQLGGTDYFVRHLRGHNFDPEVFDGRDPAAYAINILRQESRLRQSAERVKAGTEHYPVKFPYGIAETEKGFGFYGQGTNAAHGTPLPENPKYHDESLKLFNQCAARLFVSESDWRASAALLNNHTSTGRIKERESSLLLTEIKAVVPEFAVPFDEDMTSPMASLDLLFVAMIKANPLLRPRVGNPDELRSNRFNKTLDFLKHRVTDPEVGVAEAVDGAVITALNEEAVISAILANRKGLNLAISYEAFAPKMLGALRKKIILARHKKQQAQLVPWLSIPVLATSHLWENGKNEQSHQDSIFCEAMMAEMSDVSRVVFPADSASALELMRSCYQSNGQVFTMIVPKAKVANQFTTEQARFLAHHGAIRLSGKNDDDIQLIAIGAYQLQQAGKIQRRLKQHEIACSVVYLAEPGRFRSPRDAHEAAFVNESEVTNIFGSPRIRLMLSHGRPESFLGVLRPLDLGPEHTRALGYINRGGTLDTDGLLFANRCTWAHGLAALSAMDGRLKSSLSELEWAAVEGIGDPYQIIAKPYVKKHLR